MNEEEILNVLTDEIVALNVGHEKYEEAVKGLLDLYSKEKQKNKEHKTRIRNLECKIIRQKEQISGLRGKYHVDAWLEEDYISKDKIKAKIDYLKTLDFGTDLVTQSTANLTTICILSEFLEDK